MFWACACSRRRCRQGSPCAQFRADFKAFALDFADLKDEFPVLREHGLADTTFFADAIDILPPFVLFGAYEILQRVPDWRDLPADLADLSDEIGDPDAFSVDLDPGQQAASASAAVVKIGASAGLNRPATPADLFCRKGKEALVDPVRLTRLKSLPKHAHRRICQAYSAL